MSSFVPRIVQLDSLILDKELFNVLKSQLFRVFQWAKADHLADIWGPELKLILKCVLWKLTLQRNCSSVGQTLLGVKYLPEQRSKFKYLLFLEAIIPYISERLLPVILKRTRDQRVVKAITYSEDFIKFMEILNFFAFLMQNRYPSLRNRLVGLRMVPISSSVQPAVGYTYQLREMLWHQFSEFLMIVLPIMNISKIRRYLKDWKFITQKETSPSISSVSLPSKTSDNVLKCCYCKEDAILPQVRYRCVLCYYCLEGNLLANPSFECEDCSHAS